MLIDDATPLNVFGLKNEENLPGDEENGGSPASMSEPCARWRS